VLTKPLVDFSIKMLGPVEIVRIRRVRSRGRLDHRGGHGDILCFIASRSHHRTPKDTIIRHVLARKPISRAWTKFSPHDVAHS